LAATPGIGASIGAATGMGSNAGAIGMRACSGSFEPLALGSAVSRVESLVSVL